MCVQYESERQRERIIPASRSSSHERNVCLPYAVPHGKGFRGEEQRDIYLSGPDL